MISVDAEDLQTTKSSMAFVKQTQLFEELVRIVGMAKAEQIFGRVAQELPAEPTGPTEES
jgi:hypothetical protein